MASNINVTKVNLLTDIAYRSVAHYQSNFEPSESTKF